MKKKTLTIAIALVLVVALAVGATWAYLTAHRPGCQHLTVGKLDQDGALTLKEHKAVAQTSGEYSYKVNTEAGHGSYLRRRDAGRHQDRRTRPLPSRQML